MEYQTYQKLRAVTISLFAVSLLCAAVFLLRGGYAGLSSIFGENRGTMGQDTVKTILGIISLGFTLVWGVVSYLVKLLGKQK